MENIFNPAEHSFFLLQYIMVCANNFVKWARTLFEGSQSSIITDREAIGHFILERETSSGDPFSAYQKQKV